MRERLRRFMLGRYGVDDLGKVSLYLSLALLFLSMFVRKQILYTLALILLALCYARIFSKNVSKRYEENQKFLNWKYRMICKVDRMKKQRADKAHCYYKCPGCHQQVRVPKGKGKISIRCPKCGVEFVKRT